MKSDLIWGWIFIGLALIMLACVIYGCCIGNWTAIPICSFALALNVCNAISRFRDYKRWQQEYEQSMLAFNTTLRSLWPDIDEENDEPDDDNCITD